MTQRSMHNEIGQRYEAREMLNLYKGDPTLLVDDLKRLENLWVNVMPNAQFSPKYDRGFIARSLGPSSSYGQSGLGIAGSDSVLYSSIAIGVKALLQVRSDSAMGVSIISDLVDLDAAQRKKWGSHILSISPDVAATTALTLAQMSGVMNDIAKTYPSAVVRAGATQFLKERLDTLRDRGVTPGEDATPAQLESAFGAQAQLPGFKEVIDVLKAKHPHGVTQQQLHEALDEWGNSLGEKLKANTDALRNELMPLLEEAEKMRRQQEWDSYEDEVRKAQAWVSLCSTALTVVGAPPGATRLCQVASAGIELIRAITLLTRDYPPAGTINPVALASGAGAALTIVNLVSAESAGPDPKSEMLKQIMGQLDELAKQLHEVHKLVGELFSFAVSMRSEMAETLSTIRSDIQGLVSLYADTERAKLISALHVYAASAELAGATQQEVENRLAELATHAITEGSTELQTHGGPVYAGQFETVARALLTGTHAESFIGLLSDALGDLCFRLRLCSTSWPHRPPQEGPESEHFDDMVPPGRVVAPVPLVNALTLFRRVAMAHPSYADELPADGVTSITHYRRLVRAAAWMQMLLVAAREEEVLVSGVVRQQVALAGLVQHLSAIYRGFMNGRGDEARALPVEVLFGLQAQADSDWVVNSLRTLRVLHQLGALGDPRIEFGPGFAYIHVTWSIGPLPVARMQIDVHGGYRDEFMMKRGAWDKAARKIVMEADLTKDRDTIAAWVKALLNNILFLGPITWYHSSTSQTSTDWQLSPPPIAAAGGDPPHGIAAVPDGTGAFVGMKAREWAQAAIAAQAGTPGAETLRSLAHELARATLQCCALLKNHRPGVRPEQLPFSLARLVSQSEDFAIFSDVTRLFYGPGLPAFFPVHERTAYRLPPTGAQDLWLYPLEPLVAHAFIFDNAPERAAPLSELKRRIRASPGFAAFAQQLPPKGESADGVAQLFANSRSISCRSLLEQEMQFHISRADPLRGLSRWALEDTAGVDLASTFVADDIHAETDPH